MYDRDFYEYVTATAQRTAPHVFSALRKLFPSLRSLVDVGCGVGAWADAARAWGFDTVTGIDGSYTPVEARLLSPDEYIEMDLMGPLHLSERYDVALCLEVAEHLEEKRASSFVGDLCGLSDVIVFSAAIPHQGGEGHVNEQWPSYWIALFEAHGYAPSDELRVRVWDIEEIPYFYRQNILLFYKSASSDLDLVADRFIHDVVHPAKWEEKCSAV